MNIEIKNSVDKNSFISINLIDYSVLGEIRLFIQNELSNAGLKEIEIQKIVVAIDEICTNLIKHALGYKTFEIKKKENKLIIKIVDITQSFNILDMPDTNMSNYFKLFKSGGLGIKLVKLIMDKIEYFPADETQNKNTLILTKFFSRA